MAASSSPGVSPELLSAAKQWLEWDPNAETQQATQAMIEAASSEEGAAQLQAAFGSRIAFGTAGLRGRMAAGTACMNDLIVVQAAQGLVAYLQEQLGEATANARGLVLGWDHRAAGSLNSKRFAALTAHVAASKGMSVVLFEQLVATPLVPFAILARKAAAGVMVTASHNPKADNGYKVYWGNGAQIIPPHDKGIAAAITSNLQPWTAPAELRDVTWDSVVALPQVTLAGDEDISAYIAAVTASQKRQLAPDATKLPVTYTAMHGVGYPFVQAAFESFGLPPPLPVPEQVQPDPTFPTVEFPNPEEGAGALALAMAAAEAGGSRLILANDPDADRLAVAEAEEDGNWRVFTGNEIAALLAWWTWSQRGEDCPPPDQCYMLASTVSSKMIGAMARANGFHFEETLTGFKWMGNRAAALQAEGKTVLFSFEEAIGFCLGDTVLDKVRTVLSPCLSLPQVTQLDLVLRRMVSRQQPCSRRWLAHWRRRASAWLTR